VSLWLRCCNRWIQHSPTVDSQNYTLLTFTSDDDLVVSTAGLFDVLMFGGGGGGS
jgi:hypothetical protein